MTRVALYAVPRATSSYVAKVSEIADQVNRVPTKIERSVALRTVKYFREQVVDLDTFKAYLQRAFPLECGLTKAYGSIVFTDDNTLAAASCQLSTLNATAASKCLLFNDNTCT